MIDDGPGGVIARNPRREYISMNLYCSPVVPVMRKMDEKVVRSETNRRENGDAHRSWWFFQFVTHMYIHHAPKEVLQAAESEPLSQQVRSNAAFS